jgi:subtilase-type serine protease
VRSPGHRIRRHVATLLAGVCLAPLGAYAQDATWLINPASGNFNSASNWTPATVPTGTAFFGTSTQTSLNFSSNTTLGGFTFNADAPGYAFGVGGSGPSVSLTFNGAGIVNNSPNTPQFHVGSPVVNGYVLNFRNASTAGNAAMVAQFGRINFFDTSSAANASLTSSLSGPIVFNDSSKAGSARITAGGSVSGSGSILFRNSSSAENASITFGPRAGLTFADTATAGNAQISISGPFGFGISFLNASNAANAQISLGSSSSLVFSDSSAAAASTIILNGQSSGRALLRFANAASGGNARLMNVAWGDVDISRLSTAGTTAGSIEGAGNFFLGAKQFTVGSNNLSTEVSGVISDGAPSFGPGFTDAGGALVKTGTGTLILSGANTYTGGTTISGGTLQLGNGGTSGSILGNVLNNATLAFNRSDAVTFGGAISGSGVVQHNGAGTTILTAGSGYTGATTVNAGTLLVNGSIAASSGVTVNTGATVGGNGALPSTTINSGGSLSPGNSIGTISIAGNLNFVGAGNYIVEVSPAAADRTNANGTATLSGTVQAIGTGGVYTVGTRYTVLNATGGVTGTFGSLTFSGNFGITKPRLDYDANNVYIVLDPNALSPFLTGASVNERAVAAAVDAAVAAGSTAAPFVALFNLPLAQVPAALDQLSGEMHASTASVLVDESLYARSAVLGRLRQASYGGDAGMASLAMGGPQAFAAESGAAMESALAYAKAPVVRKAPVVAPAATSDIVFWAQGFGAWGRFDGDGSAASVRRDLAGFFTGVDTRVGANGRAGIAAGYTGSKNALDGRGSANVETGHVAAYSGWSFGALSLRGGGGYAFHTIDTDRTIAFPGFFDRATAHYQGGTGQVFGELGYGFNFANVAVEPFAGGAWVHLKTDAATERGGPAALNVAGTTFEVGYSTLGVRAASMIPLAENMMLVPRATLAWQHAYGNVTPSAVLAFQGAGAPFAISGAPIARDALLAEAGLDLAIGARATLGVSYTGQIARNVHDHAAKGRFSWRF